MCTTAIHRDSRRSGTSGEKVAGGAGDEGIRILARAGGPAETNHRSPPTPASGAVSGLGCRARDQSLRFHPSVCGPFPRRPGRFRSSAGSWSDSPGVADFNRLPPFVRRHDHRCRDVLGAQRNRRPRRRNDNGPNQPRRGLGSLERRRGDRGRWAAHVCPAFVRRRELLGPELQWPTRRRNDHRSNHARRRDRTLERCRSDRCGGFAHVCADRRGCHEVLGHQLVFPVGRWIRQPADDARGGVGSLERRRCDGSRRRSLVRPHHIRRDEVLGQQFIR